MISIPNIYKGNYLLLAIPALILILASIFFIFVSPNINLGVDFKGGTLVSLTLNEFIDGGELEDKLSLEGVNANVIVFETAVGYKAEVEVPQSEDVFNADELNEKFNPLLEEVSILEATYTQDTSVKEELDEKRAELDELVDEMFTLSKFSNKSSDFTNLNVLKKTFLSSYNAVYDNYGNSILDSIGKYTSYSSISVESVSPRLQEDFIGRAKNVILLAAILSIVFVFIFFRNLVPSLAVLIGAFCDVIIALGAMALFQIPLTLPSFAALLLLIGYSLDTDIMLTMRMLKRRGDPREKAFDAMKTGATMSITGIIAFAAIFTLSIMTNITTYYEISAVALAGLIGDLFATWGINAIILIFYLEKKEKDEQ